MTKLEEKLLQLGYEGLFVDITNQFYYKKGFKRIVLNPTKEKIVYSYLRLLSIEIDNQKQLTRLQQKFNQLQKDLEVLKNVE